MSVLTRILNNVIQPVLRPIFDGDLLPPDFDTAELLAFYDGKNDQPDEKRDSASSTIYPSDFDERSRGWNFDGVGDFVTIPTQTLVGDFTISFGVTFTGTSTGAVLGYNGEDYDGVFLTTTQFKLRFSLTDYIFDEIPITDTNYKVSRVGPDLICESNSATQTISGFTDDFVIAAIGRTHEFPVEVLFEGQLWDIDINGTIFHATEGSGDIAIGEDSAGNLVTGEITATSLPAFHAMFQDGVSGSDWLDRKGFSDGGASNIDLITGTDSDMSGPNNWTDAGTAAIFNVNTTVPGKLYMLGDGGDEYVRTGSSPLSVGGVYTASFKARLNTGASTTLRAGNRSGTAEEYFEFTPTSTEQTFTGSFTALSAVNFQIGLVTGFPGIAFEIDDVKIKQVFTQLIPASALNPNLDVLGNVLGYRGPMRQQLEVVESPCLTFDGVGDYAEVTDFTHTEDDFYIEISARQPAVADADRKLVVYDIDNNTTPVFQIRQGDAAGGVGKRLLLQTFNGGYETAYTDIDVFTSLEVLKIHIVKTGTSVVFKVNDVLIPSSGSVAEVISISTSKLLLFGKRTGASPNYFAGGVWNIDINGIKFPCSEGGLSTHIHDTTGQYSGEITTASLPTVWGSTQDEFHDAVMRGWWESSPSDGVYYPANVDADKTKHPAGTFNEAPSSFLLPQTKTMIAQAGLESTTFGFDGSGNQVPFIQGEIVTYCTGTEADFWCPEKKSWTKYGALLTVDQSNEWAPWCAPA